MTSPKKIDRDANTGEQLVHDSIDGATYPLSDLKGRYTERKWEKEGVSRAQVIKDGGYLLKEPNAKGKRQFIPVVRGKICPDYEDNTGARPKFASKGGTQLADPSPDVNDLSFIDELSANRKVIKAIRRHTEEMGRLELDLTKLPFLDPSMGEDHKWLNNLHIGGLHPQVRMIASLQKNRFKVHNDEDAGWKEKQAADKLVADALDKAYNRTDKGFASIFSALTKVDQIKSAVANMQQTDAAGGKIDDAEKEELRKQAEALGIEAEFMVINDEGEKDV